MNKLTKRDFDRAKMELHSALMPGVYAPVPQWDELESGKKHDWFVMKRWFTLTVPVPTGLSIYIIGEIWLDKEREYIRMSGHLKIGDTGSAIHRPSLNGVFMVSLNKWTFAWI